ncbi:hypothetical protein AB3S75_013402 [Citrus x aurantiifolia]
MPKTSFMIMRTRECLTKCSLLLRTFPLQELTYHYSYMIDQVYDSSGNIKKKSCFCGSSECTGLVNLSN